MPALGKKSKTGFRKVLFSKFLCCFCAHQDNSEDADKQSAENVQTKKLEILLLKTLKNQLEDRELHNQLHKSLEHILNILKQFADGSSSYSPNKANIIPKLTITLSKKDLPTNDIISLHKCNKQLFRGRFIYPPPAHRSREQGIQYDLNLLTSTNSKLIQTQILTTIPNLISFKVELIKHIRTLKSDVVTLRQLLNKDSDCREEGKHHCKYIEAKIRAANFMKFYRLRKVQEKSGAIKKANRIKTKRLVL